MTAGAPAAGRPAGYRAAALASLVIVALACLLRMRAVATAFVFGDEMWSLELLSRPYRELFGLYDDGGAGLALPILQKASVDLFGFSLLAVRLPSLLPALATVVLVVIGASRLVSRNGALFAAALLATSSLHVFYSRFGRSYALVAFLAYVFVASLTRVVSDPQPSAGRYVAAAVAGGLLPWVHALTVPYVVTTGAAAVVAVLLRRRAASAVVPLLVALAAAAAIAAVLYAPAWGTVVARFARERQRMTLRAPWDVIDTLTVFAGGRVAAWVLLLAVPVAAIDGLRRRGVVRLPLLAAALAPLPLTYLVAPYGGPFAYARYAIPALPAIALLLGEWTAALGRRLGPAWDRAAPALAVLLALVLWAAGPGRLVDDGPYANGYLSLVPLSGFDAPFLAMPDAYSRLEPGARIVEAPSLPSRARYMYRNYFLQHRHPTVLGFVPDEGQFPVPGPHVVVEPSAELDRSADYLVIHVDVADELMAYFDFAHDATAARTPQLLRLAGARGFWASEPRPTKDLVAALTARYGPPLVDDGMLLVYRLRPDGAGERNDRAAP